MVNKSVLPIVTVISLLLVLVAAMIVWRPDILPTDVTPTPDVTPTITPTPGEEANITITSPAAQAEVGLPLVVEGQARVFENTLQVRLLDANGDILVERHVMADAPDVGQFGPYRVELSYPEPTGDTGMVEAFQYSAKDGSEIDKVSVPVRFRQVEFTEVQVFFSNREEDPGMNNCEVTYPVTRRIPATPTVGRAALEQLLMGPSNDEAENEFFTNINAGVRVNSLNIAGGTATVDFSSELDENIGGSCLVQAIRSQITNTLTQFDTVSTVVITVNGQSEDVLQP